MAKKRKAKPTGEGVTLIGDNKVVEENFGIPNYEPPVMDPETLIPVHVKATISVNVRKDPTINEMNIIYVANKEDRFLVLDRLVDWTHVQSESDPSKIGFIKSKFLVEV